jgi:hypothetical protein
MKRFMMYWMLAVFFSVVGIAASSDGGWLDILEPQCQCQAGGECTCPAGECKCANHKNEFSFMDEQPKLNPHILANWSDLQLDAIEPASTVSPMVEVPLEGSRDNSPYVVYSTSGCAGAGMGCAGFSSGCSGSSYGSVAYGGGSGRGPVRRIGRMGGRILFAPFKMFRRARGC